MAYGTFPARSFVCPPFSSTRVMKSRKPSRPFLGNDGASNRSGRDPQVKHPDTTTGFDPDQGIPFMPPDDVETCKNKSDGAKLHAAPTPFPSDS